MEKMDVTMLTSIKLFAYLFQCSKYLFELSFSADTHQPIYIGEMSISLISAVKHKYIFNPVFYADTNETVYIHQTSYISRRSTNQSVGHLCFDIMVQQRTGDMLFVQ